MYLISNCVVRRSCAIKQDLEVEEFISYIILIFLALLSTFTNPSHHVSCLFNFFKSKMSQDPDEIILMLFTRLCLKELESSSPEVKVSELYMRRRCREKWSKMGEVERAAIIRLSCPGDRVDFQQEDLNDNNYPRDAAAAVEVEVDDGDEWQPEKKKKKKRQTQRKPSAYNAFCMAERERRGQKINGRY